MNRPASPSGRVARIDRGAVHDGPGVRTVIFLKGCPLRCGWCHSPETQAARPEVLFQQDRCLDCGTCVETCLHGAARPAASGAPVDRARCAACGRCAAACPSGARVLCGAPMTVEAVMREALRDRAVYDMSGGGVTLSGGEPLMQWDFALAVLAACQRERIHTAIETCGHVRPQALGRAAALADVVLFDLKLIDEARHRRATRVSNRMILDNLRALAAIRPDAIVRVPLVPGINDDWQNLAATAAFVDAVGLTRVDLLPYHRAGLSKYARLGREYPLDAIVPPPDGAMRAAMETFSGAGLDVRVGGSS